MAKDKTHSAKRWWVVAQHDDIQVVEGTERPTSKVAKGERGKDVRGAFASKEDAQRIADKLESRTLRVQASK